MFAERKDVYVDLWGYRIFSITNIAFFDITTPVSGRWPVPNLLNILPDYQAF